MVVLRRILLPFSFIIAIVLRLSGVTGIEITYKMLATGCEARCNKMYPRPISEKPAIQADAGTPFIDYDDVKKYACLEACRMALTAYPKSEDEIRRHDVLNKNRTD
ncbi:uncharacterized protein BXIN_1242 [Babesia sp. Xinjiang]|uniref:uncharacterized protein n=1 Tax=Babesia sp. Xinjiang TaxID=462227 RepID=UPI000A238A4A|nr:uncharacterized protein BXIN_1242 [Babesia sp. Xinjiang]ORM39997.1 hypothetical protein BXIN_1242 [Babesia sp. Xinjiang]